MAVAESFRSVFEDCKSLRITKASPLTPLLCRPRRSQGLLAARLMIAALSCAYSLFFASAAACSF